MLCEKGHYNTESLVRILIWWYRTFHHPIWYHLQKMGEFVWVNKKLNSLYRILARSDWSMGFTTYGEIEEKLLALGQMVVYPRHHAHHIWFLITEKKLSVP